MNVKNNQRLNDLKELSMKANEMTKVKGGIFNYIPGTSKPRKPGTMNAYIGISFGG